MPEATTKYLGKYRGTVVNNVDPLQQGRIQATVPDVLGDTPCTFAMPCFPVAGPQTGMYAVPVVGTGVWIEFEQGDPGFPIWTGCWFGSVAEVPPAALAGPPGQPNILLQTRGQYSVLMSDLPGGPGITLRSPGGAIITVNDTGILISNGKGATISLVGTVVDVNTGGLTVT